MVFASPMYQNRKFMHIPLVVDEDELKVSSDGSGTRCYVPNILCTKINFDKNNTEKARNFESIEALNWNEYADVYLSNVRLATKNGCSVDLCEFSEVELSLRRSEMAKKYEEMIMHKFPLSDVFAAKDVLIVKDIISKFKKLIAVNVATKIETEKLKVVEVEEFVNLFLNHDLYDSELPQKLESFLKGKISAQEISQFIEKERLAVSYRVIANNLSFNATERQNKIRAIFFEVGVLSYGRLVWRLFLFMTRNIAAANKENLSIFQSEGLRLDSIFDGYPSDFKRQIEAKIEVIIDGLNGLQPRDIYKLITMFQSCPKEQCKSIYLMEYQLCVLAYICLKIVDNALLCPSLVIIPSKGISVNILCAKILVVMASLNEPKILSAFDKLEKVAPHISPFANYHKIMSGDINSSMGYNYDVQNKLPDFTKIFNAEFYDPYHYAENYMNYCDKVAVTFHCHMNLAPFVSIIQRSTSGKSTLCKVTGQQRWAFYICLRDKSDYSGFPLRTPDTLMLCCLKMLKTLANRFRYTVSFISVVLTFWLKA